MSRRRCPRCQSVYDPPARFCLRDGTPLVDVASGEVPAPPPRRRTEPDAPAAERPAPAPTLTNTVLDGRYRIARRIGEGGMSYVYLGEQLDGGPHVAVKVLTPRLSADAGSIERLRREATLAERLDHPNVCRILAHGTTADGMLYLVMPYLRGETLSDSETRRGPYPLDDGLAILRQLCEGLQHAHDLGIIHRDLKPENVMLVPDEDAPMGVRAVVMDFGLAKALAAGDELTRLTQTGIVLGTPEFMSPEQVRGRPIDHRSDIFALGVLAFELLTGKLPFAGRTQQETMIARLKGTPTPLRQARPDLPPWLEQAMGRALATHPDQRYESMAAFAKALDGNGGVSGVFARLFGKA